MPKLFPKMVSRSYFPKLVPKTLLQSGCPKAIIFQTYSPKLFSKAAPESCSPKFLPKATPQNCGLKLFPKGVPHSKLLFKASPLQSCTEQLLGLLRKVVSEKRFPKDAFYIPQSYRFQCNCPSMLLSKPQSCSPQLLPKTALQNCNSR